MKFTVYARKEPTTDSTTLAMLKQHPDLKVGQDVCIYHDRECTSFYARFPWYYSNKPTKRNKYVTVNCFRYNLEWV